VQVCDTLSTSFRLFCRKPGREPQQARWFECVLENLLFYYCYYHINGEIKIYKWNVDKKPVLSKFVAGFYPGFDQVCSWLE